MSKERYINLSDRQVKDTQNQSQDFLSVKTICRLLNRQEKQISDLEAKLAEQQECSLKASAKHSLEMQNAQICIKELEAKLAESELKYNATNRAYWELLEKQDNAFLQYEKLIGENQQLKQQLAEKDLHIEELESQFAYECECNKQFVECQNENTQLKQLVTELDKEAQEIYEMYNQERKKNWLNNRKNQDKISFCIEQLEKVKELVEEKSMTQSPFGTQKIYASDVSGVIDNQIKQLKEVK